MFSISSVKAKIKRSGLTFENTFIYGDNLNIDSIADKFVKDYIDYGEQIIVFYKSNGYGWCLTNKKLIIPGENIIIILSDLVKIDLTNFIQNPEAKSTNRELILITKYKSYKVFFEKNTWHLFYNIFKFIISNNK